MPRLHGFRERIHMPLWDTSRSIVKTNYMLDRRWLQVGMESGVAFINERKHAITSLRTLDLWDVVLDYGELAIGPSISRTRPFPYRMDYRPG